jgi:hypothetical protein
VITMVGHGPTITVDRSEIRMVRRPALRPCDPPRVVLPRPLPGACGSIGSQAHGPTAWVAASRSPPHATPWTWGGHPSDPCTGKAVNLPGTRAAGSVGPRWSPSLRPSLGSRGGTFGCFRSAFVDRVGSRRAGQTGRLARRTPRLPPRPRPFESVGGLGDKCDPLGVTRSGRVSARISSTISRVIRVLRREAQTNTVLFHTEVVRFNRVGSCFWVLI